MHWMRLLAKNECRHLFRDREHDMSKRTGSCFHLDPLKWLTHRPSWWGTLAALHQREALVQGLEQASYEQEERSALSTWSSRVAHTHSERGQWGRLGRKLSTEKRHLSRDRGLGTSRAKSLYCCRDPPEWIVLVKMYQIHMRLNKKIALNGSATIFQRLNTAYHMTMEKFGCYQA